VLTYKPDGKTFSICTQFSIWFPTGIQLNQGVMAEMGKKPDGNFQLDFHLFQLL